MPTPPASPKNTSLDRRQFLTLTGTALTLAACGGESLEAGAQGLPPAVTPDSVVGEGSDSRAGRADDLRVTLADNDYNNTPEGLQHPTNPDDNEYASHMASFTKALPHSAIGEVDPSAYTALLKALTYGHKNPALFDQVPLGGDRHLINPQSGLTFDLAGADAHSFVMPPAPAFASSETAAEMAENYWMALLRDVPFERFGSDPIAAAAVADLNQFGASFKGPKQGGVVTPGTLLRGLTPGDLVGPYMSQFLWQPCPFGATEVPQQVTTCLPVSAGGTDYMTSFSSGPGNWLDVQRGITPPFTNLLDPVKRYIRSGRDIGQWVHIDVLFQAYLQAALILMTLNDKNKNALLDDNHPYKNDPTQDGFGTLGDPHLAALVAEVAPAALHAVWFQKWFVHRRLRPEVYGARVDRVMYGGAGYPVHPSIIDSLGSATRLGRYFNAGSAMLPMAFPEGCPVHPSYGAGHASVAGACVTVLKAWFKEDVPLASVIQPVVVSDDGTTLTPYTGDDAGQLTIGGELNKLAANIALGRNIAGVHWRSDATNSFLLGEAVAIQLLRERRATYNETFKGFSLTKFDGTTILV